MYQTLFDIHRNSTLKEAGLYSEIGEHQAIVEGLLNASRILSYIVLLVVGLIKSELVFRIVFVVFMLGYTATLIAIALYEKKYYKKSDKAHKTLETAAKNDRIGQGLFQKLRAVACATALVLRLFAQVERRKVRTLTLRSCPLPDSRSSQPSS